MKEPRRLEADEAQLAAVAERLERRSLEPDDYALLKVVIDTVCFLSRQVRQKATSIQRLLRMIFGARTEKTRAVLHRGGSGPAGDRDARRETLAQRAWSSRGQRLLGSAESPRIP